MKKNPRYALFRKILTEHQADWLLPWSGFGSRFQDIDFPTESDILSGKGAFINGGRINVKGAFPVVYLSTDEETALKESKAHATRYGLTIRAPRILITVDLQLNRVLDITKPAIRRSLNLTLKELKEENWEKMQYAGIESLGQALGRAIQSIEAEALLIPSFACRGGVNIAYFPKRKAQKSTVKVCESLKLPKAPSHKSRK